MSRFQTIRRRTVEVMAGSVGMGGDNPVRIQSMTTSDTQDVAATVRQCVALAEVGCEIIRVTAPNVPAARCLGDIRKQLDAAGFASVPLVADIHFLPAAAMEAVEHVEKVRVNPGNYADKKKFAVKDYSDADYDRELQRLHEAFSPLVLRAKALGRSLRIGTNHGSLSDRIMNRYGDTPLGMVESALEFLRIAESHAFRQIVLSMKASNPKVMIQAYRLLVARMDEENMHYPLHLGVTEAGDGEDGRIKGAIGIGSLLQDGLGDTIRVSLTEDSVYEVPVARALAAKAHALWKNSKFQIPNSNEIPNSKSKISMETDSIDPFHYARREVGACALAPGAEIGVEQPPRVIVRAPSVAALPETLAKLSASALADTPAEAVLVPVRDAGEFSAAIDAINPDRKRAYLFEIPETLTPEEFTRVMSKHMSNRPSLGVMRVFTGTRADTEALPALAAAAFGFDCTLVVATTASAIPALAPVLANAWSMHMLVPSHTPRVIFTLADAPPPAPNAHPTSGYRQLAEALRPPAFPLESPLSRAPIWIRNTAATALASVSIENPKSKIENSRDFLSRLLDASILTGSLLCDGVGDIVSVETEADPVRALRLAYNILQGAGARISKTEFVACPSCGRTLFDLQATTQRIREKTGHLKGVKLAIMGCIVNGPGEMADADFGYVGGAPGKINLYVGKNCVQYNIPQAEADNRLIELIRQHGKWTEPS